MVRLDCASCKQCCTTYGYAGNVPLTELEQEQFDLASLIYVFKEDVHLTAKSQLRKYECPYLQKDGCSLTMEERPMACQIYPFYYDGGVFKLDSFCPQTPKMEMFKGLVKLEVLADQ